MGLHTDIYRWFDGWIETFTLAEKDGLLYSIKLGDPSERPWPLKGTYMKFCGEEGMELEPGKSYAALQLFRDLHGPVNTYKVLAIWEIDPAKMTSVSKSMWREAMYIMREGHDRSGFFKKWMLALGYPEPPTDKVHKTTLIW
jgi:hypothetical protein